MLFYELERLILPISKSFCLFPFFILASRFEMEIPMGIYRITWMMILIVFIDEIM